VWEKKKNLFWRAPVFNQEKKSHNFKGLVSRTAHQSFEIMCWIMILFLKVSLLLIVPYKWTLALTSGVFFVKIDNVF